MKQKQAFLLSLLTFILLFFLPLIQKSPLIIFVRDEAFEIVLDKKVSELFVTYSPIVPARERGVLEIEFKGNVIISKILVCPITQSVVKKVNSKTFVDCDINQQKEGEIVNNIFTISLTSGEYFIDIPKELVNSHFPKRVSVHKGQIARAIISLE